MNKKKVLVFIMAIGIILVAVSSLCEKPFAKSFYVNLSGSMPIGVYKAIAGTDYRVGDLVVFDVPATARVVVYGRKMLPEGWPLMKYIAGLRGDSFCVEGNSLFVNEKYFATVLDYDSQGEPLSHMEGCREIGSDEFLPIATHTTQSYDGRYFGAVPLSSIRTRAAPVWTL